MANFGIGTLVMMTCDEARVLLYALVDGELDAGHASAVETHAATCPRCAIQLKTCRELRQLLATADLRVAASEGLRTRVMAALPAPHSDRTSRRTFVKGIALGSLLSAAAAASIAFVVVRTGRDNRILSEVVSAHLRSLQAGHLTDVESADQHTVKPWFNGRVDFAPPVVDLTKQDFTLIGGRLDYISGEAVAVIVYRRRRHVVNLFVGQSLGSSRLSKADVAHGFNIRRWSDRGMTLLAVSDLNAEELQEFGDKFEAALQSGG